MKKLILAFSTFLFALTVHAQHSFHWKIIPAYQTNLGGAQPGDTLVFNGNYTYLNNNNITGTALAPIALYMQGASFSNGLDFYNAAYFHIYGTGTDSSNYTFKVHCNGNGTALAFQGKSHDIEIDHVSVINPTYFVWFKDEGILRGCNQAAYNMDEFFVHDFYFDTAHQDGLYLMSTNEGEQRTVNCNGNIIKAVEYTGSNIRLQNGVIKNCQRNGVNYSNMSGGDSNYIDHVRIENCGYEYKLTHNNDALFQGAGIASGAYVNNLTISNCTIRNTFLPNIVLRAGGKVNCYNNILDSADYVWGFVNVQKNAALQVTASDIYPTNWNIHNNKIGWSNNDIQMVLYGHPDSSSVVVMCGDSVINTTNVLFKGCSDTTIKDTIIVVPKDTTILYFTFDSMPQSITFHRADGSTETFSNADHASGNPTKKIWRIYFLDKTSKAVK